jgi:hypothetical protein
MRAWIPAGSMATPQELRRHVESPRFCTRCEAPGGSVLKAWGWKWSVRGGLGSAKRPLGRPASRLPAVAVGFPAGNWRPSRALDYWPYDNGDEDPLTQLHRIINYRPD